MRFVYCPHCGQKLIKKEIGDEGRIPYCEACAVPLWDMFTTSVLCAVTNEEDEIALLRQDYVSQTSLVCVAGIMKIGESAEEAAVREIKEEIGQDVVRLQFIRTYPYEKKEMLMVGFHAEVEKTPFVLSQEVDAAEWVKLADAPARMRQGSIAWQLVQAVMKEDR